MGTKKNEIQEVVAEVLEQAVDSNTVVEEPKTKFNVEEFSKSIVLAFADHEAVDVVADTDLDNPRDTSCTEYEYIHFFKKGTQKDLFKMYNKGRKTRFAVSSKLDINSDTGYDVKPVMNTKTNTVKWINVFTGHDDAVEVAKILIKAYADMPIVEKPVKEKKAASEKIAKAEKTTKPRKKVAQNAK